MKKVLVVSDNDILNVLYVLNIEAYLGANVVVVRSVDEASMILTNDRDIKLIVTLDRIGKSTSSDEVVAISNKLQWTLPVIITGSDKNYEVGDKFFYQAGKYDVPSMIKKGAKILGVTAKQMAGLNVGEYYPIPLIPLRMAAKAPCSIFLDLGNQEYSEVAKVDDDLTETLFKKDISKYNRVYVKSSDRLNMINKITVSLMEKIVEKLKKIAEEGTTTEKVSAVGESFEFAVSSLFSSEEVRQQVQAIGEEASKVMQSLGKDVPNVKGLMDIMLANKNGYIYMHSMIASYAAYHMIKRIDWGGHGQIEKINFVLFFHDLYLGPIYLKNPELKYEEELLESSLLDDKEKEIVLNHAKLAAEMVVQYKKAPLGVDVLIRQHHGMKKGKGFARFYTEDLSPLTKIILIAEAFTEEFLKLTENYDMRPTSKMIVPKLIAKFKSPSYTKLIQSLENVPI